MKQLQRAVDLAPEVELFRHARDLLQEKLNVRRRAGFYENDRIRTVSHQLRGF